MFIRRSNESGSYARRTPRQNESVTSATGNWRLIRWRSSTSKKMRDLEETQGGR